MLEGAQDKQQQQQQSDECGSVSDWNLNQQQQQKIMLEGLSSHSSVCGGNKQQQVASVSSTATATTTLKEHDYIGMSEVTSAEVKCSMGVDLHLEDTELRLGPLEHPGESKNGAPFQPKPAAAGTTHNSLKLVSFGETEPELKNSGEQEERVKYKRAFAQVGDAHGRMLNIKADGKLSKLSPLYPWKAAKQSFTSPRASSKKEEVEEDKHEEESPARAPVGWPPVQSFRKSTISVPQQTVKKQGESKPSSTSVVAAAGGTSQVDLPSSFIKVYMDGVSIGRKVDIKSHDSYDKLAVSLEEMFRHHINGTSKDVPVKVCFGSEYVLTYEDKDGDLMLVGDVPWNMFKATVKRLRIMKGSDAIGLVS